jgi:L-ascorbate metabolism protein UlaG (beta-lactamase superfamily)
MRSNRYLRARPSDHFDGVRFFNPGQEQPDKNSWDVLKWQAAGGRAKWPAFIPVVQATPVPRCQQLRVTMVGHATTLIQFRGLNILTDPVWSDRASPVPFAGPRRVTIPGVAFEALPRIDYVLLSHNHYDHLDLKTLERLHGDHAPTIITPLGNDAIIHSRAPEARVLTGDWHDSFDLSGGVTATIVPANHWSARGTRDRRMALWSGFLLAHGDTRVYFAGDTGYCGGSIFRGIRARYGDQSVALLPIGAYEPRWFMAPQHVNPAEALQIMEDVGARHALGIHWGTFRLTNEGRDAPKQALSEAVERKGLPQARFQAAEPGAVYDFEAN